MLGMGINFQKSQQIHPIPDNESLLADLITAITTIPDRFALILDDLQVITEVEILDGLFFLLENLPPGPKGMHLIIASRNDPPWPLARLRASNEITEIRARDLSFTRRGNGRVYQRCDGAGTIAWRNC